MRKTDVSNPSPVPKGILVIIGGHENKGEELKHNQENSKPEILETFIKLIGKDNPVVEVITSASCEGDEMFEDYKKAFQKLNVTQIGQIHHQVRKEVLEDELADRVQKADAFFFTGGNQLLLTSLYGGTSFLTHLKERYISEKIVIGGTSAGAMAMSTPMIYAGNKDKQQIAGEIKITTGLEFLKDVCIDTHFIDRSRFVRMAQVLASNPTSIGIGIEENTAVIVREGLKAEVIGKSVVIIIEGFSITSSNITEFSEDKALSIRDLKVHLLPGGSFYDIPQTNPPHK
ncbi:cyanophycinase [Segetibacter koreensis]|uniref:cyanophycinase n=1 Tax=Segetibacter koreensis TaxID=398037 RepID=UPI000367F0B5|nr:cyanophycinase [Segetibacter koreensis]